MAGVHTIDKLPAKDRERVIQMLLDAHANVQPPDYQGIISKLKLKCSKISLWRYDTQRVKPTIRRNLDVILSPQGSDSDRDKGDSLPVKTESNELAQSEIRQRLVDDPIVQAIIAKRRRMEDAIADTFKHKAYETYAKLESVDLRALEMHAKAMQHPGFVASAPQQTAGATVVVVMPTAADPRMQAWQQRQGAIEVVPDRDDSES